MTNCIFCRISHGELPAKIVYEDVHCVAFEDINPKAPVHLLVIPRRHIDSINNMEPEDECLVGHLFLVARELARQRGVEKSGYRTIINTGPNAGQSVFHIHLHLLAGRPMRWPPG